MPVASVLMLELNELAPPVMDRLIAAGQLPNFERFRSESVVAVTDPEAPQERLDPWIQWVTVHTGVGHAAHGIEKLNEAHLLRQPTIGEVVGRSGRRAWICGSMNLPPAAAGGGPYLPDPWNAHADPAPESLAAFNDFVRANVQEHTNDNARLSPKGMAEFGWHQLRHGLQLTTVRSAVGQLFAERRGTRGRWARASVLDRFQWDVFRWYWRRERPAFGSFFSNSTAHYQHIYWRNFEPEHFVHQPSADDQRSYADAVPFGYRAMDALVGRAMDLADETGATLMLCTALSQQPFTRAEESGGKYIYRPHNFAEVVAALGVDGATGVEPVMSEQFFIEFGSEEAAGSAFDVAAAATVDGRELLRMSHDGRRLFMGCALHHIVPEDAWVQPAHGPQRRFYDLFYRSDTAKSGYHHPDGMWWTRTGEHVVVDSPVSLRCIAPTVLGLLGIEPPATMDLPPLDLESARR